MRSLSAADQHDVINWTSFCHCSFAISSTFRDILANNPLKWNRGTQIEGCRWGVGHVADNLSRFQSRRQAYPATMLMDRGFGEAELSGNDAHAVTFSIQQSNLLAVNDHSWPARCFMEGIRLKRRRKPRAYRALLEVSSAAFGPSGVGTGKSKENCQYNDTQEQKTDIPFDFATPR